MTDMTATLQTDEECWKFWAEAGNKGLKANGEKAVLRAHESSCLAALFLIAGQHPEVEKLAPELRAAGLVCCIIDHRHPHFEKLSKDGISAVLHRPVDEAPLPDSSVAKSKVPVQAEVFGAKNSPEVKDPPKREQSEEREVRNAEALPETAAFFGSSDSDSEDDAKPASPEQPPIRGAAPKSSVVPLSRPKVAKHTTEARCVVEPDKDSEEEEDEESSEEDEEEEAPQKEDQKTAPKSQQASPKQSTARKSRCILSEDESSDVSDDRSSPRPAENAKDSASKVTSSVRFGRRRSPLPRLRQKRREERRRAERSDRSRRDSRSSSRRRSRSRRASAEASPARFPFAARGQPRSKRKAEPPRLKSRRERSQEEREMRRDEEYKEHRQRYRREVELRTHRERQRQDEELREQKEREKREKELKEQKEREQREKERREREHREKERKEKEQREREAREREQRERARREREQREKEAREREQREREQRERERREREQREKETREREQKERELRELREREQREQELRQLKEREQRERELKELQERERRERELKELQERERRERELKELQERERRERELKELQERERRERELKEFQERERRERELKELQERERREKELREQQEKELQAARDQDRKREPKSQPAPDPRMPTQAVPSAPDSKPLFVMHVGAEQDQAATAFKEASRIAANRQAGSSTSQANLSEQLGGGPKLLKVERHKDHPMAQIKLNQQETAEQILRLRPSHINGVPVKNWERLSNDPSAFLILWEGDRNALDDATLESHFNQMIQQLSPQNPPPTQTKDDEEDKRLMEQINKAIEDTRKARGVQELQQKVMEDLEFKMVSVYEDMIVRQRFLDHARNRQDSFQNLSDAERQMLAQFQSDLQQLQQTHALLEREMESKLFPWEREALYARLRAKKHQAAQQAEAKLQMHVREQAQQAQQAQLAQQQAQQLQQAYMQQMQQAQLQQAQIRQQRQQYQLQQAQMQHMQRQTQQAPWEQSQVKDAAMNDQYHLAQQLQEQIHWEEHLVESRSPPRPICKTQAQAPPPPPPPPKDAENASPGVTGNAPPVVPIIVPKEGSLLGKARTFASDSNIPPGVIALQAGLRPEGRPIVPRNLLQEAKEGPPKKFTPPIPASTGKPGGIVKAPTLTASLPAPPPQAQITAHLPPSFAAAPAEDAAPCAPCMEGTTPKPRSVVEPSDGSSAKCPPRTRPVGKAPMQIMPEGLDAVSQPGLTNDAMAAPPAWQAVIKARRRIYEPPETLPEFPPEEEIVEIDPETTSAPAPATPPAPAMSFPPDTPDGLPLDGSAASGSAPDGVPSDGFPPHDPAPDTFPSDGSAPRGLDADGSAPHPPDALPLGGSSPDGSPPDGLPPDGLAPPGSAPDILDADGSAPHGLDADDLDSDGLAPDTPEICPPSPDGLPPDGFAPDAFQVDGSAPDISLPDGSWPDGLPPDTPEICPPSPDGLPPDGFAPDAFQVDGSAPDISLPDGSWPDGLPPDGFVPDGPVPDSLPVDGSTPGFPDSLPSDDFPPDSSHPDSLPSDDFPPDSSPTGGFPPDGSGPPDSFPPDGSAPDPPDGSAPDLPDSFPPDGSALDPPDSFPPDGSAPDPPDSFPPDGSAPDPPDSFPPDGSAPDPPDSFPPDGSAPDSTIEDVLSDSVLRDDPNNDIAVEASAPVPHPSPAAPIPAWSVRRSTFQTAIANLKRASAGRAASTTLGRPLIKPFLKPAVHRAQHPQGGLFLPGTSQQRTASARATEPRGKGTREASFQGYASARHGVLCMQAARQGTPVPEPNIPPSRASWAQPENRAPVPEPSMPPSKASWAEAAIEGTPVPEPNTPVPEPSRPPAANRGTPVPEPSRPPSRDVEWHNDEWHKDEDLVRFGATAAPKASAASKGSGKFGHFRPAFAPPLTAFSAPAAVTAVPSKGKGVKRLRDEMGKSGRPGYMAWGASNPNSRFGYK